MTAANFDLIDDYLQLREDVSRTLLQGEPHSYGQYVRERLGIGVTELDEFIKVSTERFACRLNHGGVPSSQLRIPPNFHFVWVTSSTAPAMPPEVYLAQIADHPSVGLGWRCNFWTNSPPLWRSLKDKFARAGSKVEVLLLKDFFSEDPLLEVIHEYETQSKFVCAADVARVLVLSRIGGLYSDLGVKCSARLLEIAKFSDVVLNIDKQHLLQLAFLGFSRDNPFITRWPKICLDPERYTSVIFPVGKGCSGIEELSVLSGPGFTAAVLLLLKEVEDFILLVPQQGKYMQISSQRSWYGESGKFGNVVVYGTKATRLDQNRHDRSRAVVEEQFRVSGMTQRAYSLHKLQDVT
jgi:hypothetical protein